MEFIESSCGGSYVGSRPTEPKDADADEDGYSNFKFPVSKRGTRKILMFGTGAVNVKLFEDLTDAEISAKLPVHLRHLPDAIAA